MSPTPGHTEGMHRKPAPLPAGRAGRTLVQRLARVADRIRPLNTRFGLRSRRVFLVWTRFDGDERGEGDERVIMRHEILPTPQVSDASAINYRPWSGGTLPEGTIRVDQISMVVYTPDVLTGVRFAKSWPGGSGEPVEPGTCCAGELVDDPQGDFFYEIVEDDRGDEHPVRDRFRLYAKPWRAEARFGFSLVLEAASQPTDRFGDPVENDV